MVRFSTDDIYIGERLLSIKLLDIICAHLVSVCNGSVYKECLHSYSINKQHVPTITVWLPPDTEYNDSMIYQVFEDRMFNSHA